MTRRLEALGARRSAAGFTLMELGLTLSILAIMMIVVLASRGFIENAKIGSSVSMVQTIQQASRAYAERTNMSRDFLGVSIGALQGAQLLPPGPFQSPFDTAVTVAPTGANNEQIQITFTASSASTGQGCRTALQKMGTISGAGTAVDVVSR
jgi:Tfp pilus assembly protein PilE